jgi:hypothetical protein
MPRESRRENVFITINSAGYVFATAMKNNRYGYLSPARGLTIVVSGCPAGTSDIAWRIICLCH